MPVCRYARPLGAAVWRRHASCLAPRRSRSAREEREPTREAAFHLACEDDTALVLRFASAARRHFGDASLCDEMVEPLASLCGESARGALPSAAWADKFSNIQTIAALPSPPQRRKEQWSTLLARLQERIPPGAHEARLCVAAAAVPSRPSDANAALNMLMEGALKCGSQSLQIELLDSFRALADADGLGLAGLVQAPLLRKLGAPEARDLPDAVQLDAANPASTMCELDCLLAAADLARRGKQPGAKHGCVLIEQSAGRVLGVGFNHHITDSNDNNIRRMIHAEVHAVADAIRRHGEQAAFEAFPRSTAFIVELVGEVGYDQAHPCPKCEGMLRAVGMSEVRHTQSGTGSIVARSLGPPLPHLLAQRYGVCAPLHILLREEFQVTIQAGAAAAC